MRISCEREDDTLSCRLHRSTTEQPEIVKNVRLIQASNIPLGSMFLDQKKRFFGFNVDDNSDAVVSDMAEGGKKITVEPKDAVQQH